MAASRRATAVRSRIVAICLIGGGGPLPPHITGAPPPRGQGGQKEGNGRQKPDRRDLSHRRGDPPAPQYTVARHAFGPDRRRRPLDSRPAILRVLRYARADWRVCKRACPECPGAGSPDL